MQMKHLEYFVRTSKFQSFNEAAKSLYISQPSLSAIIANLEQELGYPLFIRSKAGIKLSKEGSTVLPYALKILELQHKMTALKPESLHVSGKVEISAPDIVCETILLELFLLAKEDYPDLEIVLHNDPNNRRPSANNHNNQSLSLSMNFFQKSEIHSINNSPLRHHLRFLKLLDTYTFVYMNARNKLARQEYISLDSLSQCTLVTYEAYNTLPYPEMYQVFPKEHIIQLPTRELIMRTIERNPNYVGFFSSVLPLNCPQIKANTICFRPFLDLDTETALTLVYPVEAEEHPILAIITDLLFQIVHQYARELSIDGQ